MRRYYFQKSLQSNNSGREGDKHRDIKRGSEIERQKEEKKLFPGEFAT